MLAMVAAGSHRIGGLLKGRSDLVIRDGALLQPRAREKHLSENDVMEDIRLNGHVERIEDVALGHLERNGDISVVPSKKRGQ